MTIKSIDEIPNPNRLLMKPIKEKQDIIIPDIKDENISKRNGMIYILTGSGGSGKTSLLLNMFKNKDMYRGKFHNIYYFCPESSFLSVVNHPFKDHPNVYHELTVTKLEEVYDILQQIKVQYEEKVATLKSKKDKSKKKPEYKILDDDLPTDDSTDDSDDEEPYIQYSCIIIDDFADVLKDNDIQKQLNKMLIKARHCCCSYMFTLQSFFYFPKILRKQLTYTTIFKPKNIEEWNSISKELFNMNKDDALKVFNYVFDKPYNHIDIDTVDNKYYKNFNKIIFSNE
jgi:hypothetical protein